MKQTAVYLLLSSCLFAADASNSRTFEKPCPAVLSSAVRVMVDKDFHPVLTDKDTGLATFSYVGPVLNVPYHGGTSTKEQMAFLTQFVKWQPRKIWQSPASQLRYSAITLLVSPTDSAAGCTAKVKIDYAVLLNTEGWKVAESNFVVESTILGLVADSFSRP